MKAENGEMEAEVQAGPAVARKAEHNAVIDSLRGLAAAMVLVFHMEFWGFPILPAHIAALGALGVNLFFTLSGFLIARAVLSPPHFDRMDYMKNRSLRILPNYFICCFVVLFLVNGKAIGHATPGELAFDLGTHAILMHGWFASTANSILGTLWTLSHEWIFYLLMAVVAPFLRSRRGWIVPLAMCVVAIAAKFLVVSKVWQPSTGRANPLCMWDQFAIGIVGAQCWIASKHWKFRSRWIWIAAVAGVLLVGACFYRQYAAASALHAAEVPELLAGRTKGMGGDYAEGFYRRRSNIVWFPLLFSIGVSLVLMAVSSDFRRLNDWLKKTPLPWMGKVSYSTYLYHLAILICLARGLSKAPEDYLFGHRGAACVVVLIGVYAMSAFGYHYFEKPWLARKARA